MRIDTQAAAVLLIDVQERLFPHVAASESLRRQCERLLEGAAHVDVPVLLTQQYTKGLGPTLASLTERLPSGTAPIEKISFSCCGEPRFMEALRSLGRRQILIAGIETHVCVLQTALDLRRAEYEPFIVVDAVGSRRETDREVALERLKQAGCPVTTVESLLFELCGRAGTDTFKAISRLVK